VSEKPEIYFIGHAHIDASWLWTWHETIHDICPRTFRDMLRIMDAEPGFCFSQSSAQIYKWVERYYPDIFTQIHQRIGDKRWEIVGGSWVEHSGLLLSGESLCRQYLYGQRYFQSRFNQTAKAAWLPDTFGFHWSMPQILRNFGIEFFYNSKLRYESHRYPDAPEFPYWMFCWQGPDGSEVLATIPSLYAYRWLDVECIEEDLQGFSTDTGCHLIFKVFGRGDHGGGPVGEALSQVQAFIHNESANYHGHFGRADDFVSEFCQRVDINTLPKLNDELYFATHRGTLTSEAFTKIANRRLEELLLDVESLSVITQRPDNHKLEELWQRFLLTQVHDNLDGTSSESVYQETATEYREIEIQANQLLSQRFECLTSTGDSRVVADAAIGENMALEVFNGLAWRRSIVLKLEAPSEKAILTDSKTGLAIPQQNLSWCSTSIPRLCQFTELPALGHRQYVWRQSESESAVTDSKVSARGNKLENEFLELEIDRKTGALVGLFDKVNDREMLGPEGARLLLVPDGEERWSAWNIQLKQEGRPLIADSKNVVESGPLRASIEMFFNRNQAEYVVGHHQREYKGRHSIQLKISLLAGQARVDFDLSVVWHQRYQTLRWELDPGFLCDRAQYEIPFGRIERFMTGGEPANTELSLPRRNWNKRDATKEENGALRWVNVKSVDGKRGLLLLNNGRYGFSFHKGRLGMTLLRSGIRKVPYNVSRLRNDYFTDQSSNPHIGQAGDELMDGFAVHRLKWSLIPHNGQLDELAPTRLGYEINHSPRVKMSHGGCRESSFLEIGPREVTVSCLKPSEDDAKKAIARLVNSSPKSLVASLKIARPLSRAWKVDMMESGEFLGKHELSLMSEQQLNLELGPFEVATLLLEFER
jgi:alpha-mannosidase